MKFIAHRGNTAGPNPKRENSVDYINEALAKGFDVELDIWYINDIWYLGHDYNQYEIGFNFIWKNRTKFWCHAKNKEALFELLKYHQINCFWHQEDKYTITSKRFIWAYPGSKLVSNSICVMPERVKYSHEDLKQCYAICSDFRITKFI